MTDTQQYTTIACARCAMPFAVTKDFEEKRKADHGTFCCPAGHSQYWPQQTDAERLRELATSRGEELARLRNELARCEKRCRRKKK